ncbi:MAG: hypothetical protein NTW87_23765 [Planctomycetota bacterium]|nr:hypothetical protein [Planctomycetota bacterium]
MMTRMVWVCVVMCGAATLVADCSTASAAEGANQPVLLLCPYRTRYSAWSLFLTVDRADPTKVLAMGLEELTGVNSEDLGPGGYEKALAKQRDPKTPRKVLDTLAARDFAAKELCIEKNDALHVSLTPAGQGTYRLMLSLRIDLERRFVIGGKEQAKRDVVLRYDANSSTWRACALTLVDSNDKKLTAAGPAGLSGIVFPVLGSGIPRVIGVLDDGGAPELYEKRTGDDKP